MWLWLHWFNGFSWAGTTRKNSLIKAYKRQGVCTPWIGSVHAHSGPLARPTCPASRCYAVSAFVLQAWIRGAFHGFRMIRTHRCQLQDWSSLACLRPAGQAPSSGVQTRAGLLLLRWALYACHCRWFKRDKYTISSPKASVCALIRNSASCFLRAQTAWIIQILGNHSE